MYTIRSTKKSRGIFYWVFRIISILLAAHFITPLWNFVGAAENHELNVIFLIMCFGFYETVANIVRWFYDLFSE